MNLSTVIRKKLAIGLHIAAWIVILAFPAYFLGSNSGFDTNFLMRVYSHLIAYILLFYINFIWLIPHFFFKGKKYLYFLSAVIAIASLFLVVNTTNHYIIPEKMRDLQFEAKLDALLKESHIGRPPKDIHILNFLLNSVMICGFSLGLKFSEKYVQNEKEKKELERERLNSELAFLKNQVSPHFFFNTLNNIYSLIQINTDDAQSAVLKLSKLMRYLLYESEQGNTLLSREIDFMKNYIDLMRLRLSDKVELIVSFPEKYDDISIPPLLFVSFIENAFKHGVSYREKSFIHIEMNVDSNEVRFSCKNSLGKHTEETQANNSGIGLENIRKRLTLIYPNHHSLSIKSGSEVFEVSLQINHPSIQQA